MGGWVAGSSGNKANPAFNWAESWSWAWQYRENWVPFFKAIKFYSWACFSKEFCKFSFYRCIEYKRGFGWGGSNSDYKAISVQLKLQLPAGIELAKREKISRDWTEPKKNRSLIPHQLQHHRSCQNGKLNILTRSLFISNWCDKGFSSCSTYNNSLLTVGPISRSQYWINQGNYHTEHTFGQE